MNMGNSIRGFPSITKKQFSKDFYDSDIFLKVLAHFCAPSVKKRESELHWPLPRQQGSWTMNKAKESISVASQLPLGPAKKYWSQEY